jgi:hypothetical protein
MRDADFRADDEFGRERGNCQLGYYRAGHDSFADGPDHDASDRCGRLVTGHHR